MKYKKLSQWAKDNGLSYNTAFRYFRNNQIENVKQLKTGTILVGYEEEEENKYNKNDKRVIIYSRVSSNEMKENLNRQQKRLEEYCISKGYTIIKSLKEISSGMNDNRPKLKQILQEKNFDILVVEHKDRLTRFGFNYIETLLNKEDKKIEVVNLLKNDNENLMEDLISIIYSFSARMYGQRKSKKKVDKIIRELKTNDIS
ncbi:IS607 family transposase [bacterium]|nr:IS607 family transposase [bacterium]